MATKSEINAEILKITMVIKLNYPELIKYLNEMTVTIPDLAHPDIDTKVLSDYCDSLHVLVQDYALSHKYDE
jgi:hypothetical protein